MGANETTLNPSVIDWAGLENHALLNPRWSKVELENLFEVARHSSQERELQGHIWMATSGSTAASTNQVKLVSLSKAAFLASAKSVNLHLQALARDIWLQGLPRFHVGGLGVEVRAFLSGSRVIQDLEKWDPVRVHAQLLEQQVTLTALVPTQVFDLVQLQLRSPPTLRAVIVGGGALVESLYLQARALGWPLLPSYGLTETCSQIATAPLDSLAGPAMPWPMSLPQKLSHVDWKLSEEGLLQLRGPSLMTCYGQRLADGGIQTRDPKVDSWFTTEDFVVLQNDFIRFTGRKNDFIKIGGEGSSMGRLREIFERILLAEAPNQALELGLIEAPSSRLGQEIQLVCTTGLGKDLVTVIQEKFNHEVLPFERIREVKYVTKIPRSELGKILWTRLKKELYES